MTATESPATWHTAAEAEYRADLAARPEIEEAAMRAAFDDVPARYPALSVALTPTRQHSVRSVSVVLTADAPWMSEATVVGIRATKAYRVDEQKYLLELDGPDVLILPVENEAGDIYRVRADGRCNCAWARAHDGACVKHATTAAAFLDLLARTV